jgi:hypothetical protein
MEEGLMGGDGRGLTGGVVIREDFGNRKLSSKESSIEGDSGGDDTPDSTDRGRGTRERDMPVGESIVRGERGGEFGTPLVEIEKKGYGATASSSS